MMRRLQGARTEDGAAAVEFALVSTLLFTLLIGIIQYGLYFNDSISARQGIRDAARSGVVRSFPACGSATTDIDTLKCNAKKQVGSLMGTTYIKVYYPAATAAPSTPAWVKGNPLKVCAMVSFNGPVKLVPMPSGGWIQTQTTMAVEQDTTPVPTGATTSDTLPSGKNWNWCTAP